jgi:hypothetical protein
MIVAIREDDEAGVEAIVRLSSSHRLFAPLAFAIGAFAMLLRGVRVLLTNWRLLLVQMLPAMWIWLAMYDLKAHALHGKSFHVLHGWVLVPINLLVIALTIASYHLNAVFAHAITRPGSPQVRPAFRAARNDLRTVVVVGGVIGLLLGLATTVVTRWGSPWFALSLGVVVGLMMVTYVAVPARLIGVDTKTGSRRDKLTATAISSALSTTVCTPPYLLGRIGILMLGSKALFVPGLLLFVIGAALQAGATGAVRAIKMSSRLV